MADLVPLAQFPPGQPPAVSCVLTALLCTVLGAITVDDDTVTALGVDEAGVVALLTAAVDVLAADQATVFEGARWKAAQGARSA